MFDDSAELLLPSVVDSILVKEDVESILEVADEALDDTDADDAAIAVLETSGNLVADVPSGQWYPYEYLMHCKEWNNRHKDILNR